MCLTLSLMAFHSTELPQQEVRIIEKREKLSDFSAFINKFYYDMTFQRERVVFPCIAKYTNTEDDIPIIEVYTEKNWDVFDRNIDSEYEMTIELISHKKVIVHLFVCESCRSIYHQFELVNDKWFLVRVMDY
jgi:hypothetical protein